MKSYRIHYARNTVCIIAKDFDEAKSIGGKWGNVQSMQCLDDGKKWPERTADGQYMMNMRAAALANNPWPPFGTPMLTNTPFGSIASILGV